MKRRLAYLSTITVLIFLIAVVVLLFLAPEVDPVRSGISFYALARYSLLIGVALTLVGASGIFLAVALWPTKPSVIGRTGLALLIAWGIMSILAGIFPLDDPGTTATTSGSIHNMAGLNFLLVVPAVLLIELSRSSQVDPIQPNPITYWLSWLVLVSAILLFTFNGPLYNAGIGGLIQRLYWLILALWLLFKAHQILKPVRKNTES